MIGHRIPRSLLSLLAASALLIPEALHGDRVSASLPAPPPLPLANPFAAPVSSEPGSAVRPCAFTQPTPGEIRLLYSHDDHGSGPPPGGEPPAVTAAVDPVDPCHVYRAYSDQLTRSDDSGAHSTPVLVDRSESYMLSPGPMQLGPVVPVGGGQLYTYDRAGNDGVMYSGDYGHTWQQRSSGVITGPSTVQSEARTNIRAVVFAPSQPQTGFLLALAGAVTLVYRTTDGGQSWSLFPTPITDPTSIVIDPGDPYHMYVVGDMYSYSATLWDTSPSTWGGGATYETRDGGGSWAKVTGPLQNQLLQVLVTRTGARAHLYGLALVASSNPFAGPSWWESDDDGASWLKLPLPDGGTLIADPLDPRLMVWAGFQYQSSNITVYGSRDGFQSIAHGFSFWLQEPYAPSSAQLAADLHGDVFVHLNMFDYHLARDQLYAMRFTTVMAQPSAASWNVVYSPPLPSGWSASKNDHRAGGASTVAGRSLQTLPRRWF